MSRGPWRARLPSAPLWIALATVATLVAVVLASPFSVQPASTSSPITLTQSWIQVLNDAPCGVAEASPVAATLGSGIPAVEVGDREGNLYAFSLTDGSVPAGWSNGPDSASVGSGQSCDISGNDGQTATPAVGVNGIGVPGHPAIDSTASVIATQDGDILYLDGGNAATPNDGGYYAYSSSGQLLWNQVVNNPATDAQSNDGVEASPSVGQASGAPFVNAGSLGEVTYALGATDGIPLPGFPFFSADTVFSTAAVGDLYGTGQDEMVVGGASTAGFAYGKHYQNGGHLRIINDHGGLICAANTNEEVDSSPAVGPILPGGALGIATGTGSFYGTSDDDTVKVYDTRCNQVWSQTLNGTTGGSPALADLTGNGQLDVVEGTSHANITGSVYALNSATGAVIWETQATGAVIGSVTTADLSGDGTQDVIVPTTDGLEILDGQTGAQLVDVDDGSTSGGAAAGKTYGFQNAPLVTDDPDGEIGITVAGYFAVADSPDHDVEGMVQHFTVAGSNGALVNQAGAWPQFHHDPSLSGFTTGAVGHVAACQVPPAVHNGYLQVASDGGVFNFGGESFCGSAGNVALTQPIVGVTQAPDQPGYWLAASDGGVFAYGGAPFYGSTGGIRLNKPIIGITATPDGGGYWLAASDGGVFAFGDAQFYGSAATTPGLHVVAFAATPDGEGYWEVTSNGAVHDFGDAGYFGGANGLKLSAPIVGLAPDAVTGGYWLVSSNGGVYSYNAPFEGSAGGLHLAAPIVGMVATDDGGGYWLSASDGGIFAFGDAPYGGSANSYPLVAPIVGISGF
jgi:hypothetical protein